MCFAIFFNNRSWVIVKTMIANLTKWKKVVPFRKPGLFVSFEWFINVGRHLIPERNNSRLIKGNFKNEITALKQQPGKDIIVYGSGKRVNALMQPG